MSALGQKQTLDCRLLMSAIPPKADIREPMSAKCQKRTYALQVFGNNQEGSRALSEAERQLAEPANL
jgi:hypothetical protein